MVRELIELNNKTEVNATTTPEHNMNINNAVVYFDIFGFLKHYTDLIFFLPFQHILD